MNKSKGFTIIELIVVIAVIAVLASIVLMNVTQYIAKGKNSAIKGNMATILTNSSVYYDQQNPSTYAGFATTTGYTQPAAAIANNGGTMGTPVTTTTNFCACTTLNVTNTDLAGNVFCVDSTGNRRVTTTGTSGAPILCSAECPASGICDTTK